MNKIPDNVTKIGDIIINAPNVLQRRIDEVDNQNLYSSGTSNVLNQSDHGVLNNKNNGQSSSTDGSDENIKDEDFQELMEVEDHHLTVLHDEFTDSEVIYMKNIFSCNEMILKIK